MTTKTLTAAEQAEVDAATARLAGQTPGVRPERYPAGTAGLPGTAKDVPARYPTSDPVVPGFSPFVAPSPQPVVAPNVPEPRAQVPTGGPVVSHQGTASTVGHAPEGVVGPVAPGVSRAHRPLTPVSPGYPKSTPDGVVLDWGPNGPPTEERADTPTPRPVTPTPLPGTDTRHPNPMPDARVPPVRDARVPTTEPLIPARPRPTPPERPTPNVTPTLAQETLAQERLTPHPTSPDDPLPPKPFPKP